MDKRWTTAEFMAALQKAGVGRSRTALFQWLEAGQFPDAERVRIGNQTLVFWPRDACRQKIRDMIKAERGK